MKKQRSLPYLQTFLAVIFLSISQYAFSAAPTSIKEAIETQQRSQSAIENIDANKQIVRPGSTPLSTLLTLKELVKQKKYEEGTIYLDLRYLPQKVKKVGAPKLLKQLMIIWQQQNLLDLTAVSNSPDGMQNDGLPPYRDLIGYLKSTKGKIPVYLQKVPDPAVGYLWKISNRTLIKVPALWSEFGYPSWATTIANYLPDFKFFHMENWQFVGVVFIVVLSWYAIKLLTTFFGFIWLKLYPERTAFQHFLVNGLRFAVTIWLLQYGINQLGLSLQAKVVLTSGILDYLAIMFLSLGIIELIAQRLINKLNEKFSRALIRPLSTTVKVLVVIVLILSWLSDAGYSLTTVLTGLGIGSLAIALAAQKTLENVFGAFTLYIARPIKPGDFCKFGEITGTVEEIGLRSTRIRKLNRSIVHVPNSIFASKELENYAEIDRRLYKKELRVRLDTSVEQLRLLLIALRELIISHPKTLDIAARARFEEIERDAFLIVVNAYVNTKSLPELKAIAEDLNFHILDILHKLNIRLATPEQRIVITKGHPIPEDVQKEAEAKIQELIEQEKLPFPNFSDDEKAAIKDTLAYPPPGSPKKEKTEDS
ncbi:mechanosensitive ion channel family protein [Hydrogenovibrio kuenenii]|uniref:mechanosensitive ion channel family protein n=1 Tax=Hydrogenovibrio kuenenii TaxID=63658 RepID=UPI000466761E|nr:mechanosensitive ion channel family protein [Hydrogenovibrio kuenenii]